MSVLVITAKRYSKEGFAADILYEEKDKTRNYYLGLNGSDLYLVERGICHPEELGYKKEGDLQ